MKLIVAATLLASASAFAPITTPSTFSFSTGTALASTATPPERVAPDAGYTPEWEDRPGLPEEEFLNSDLSKDDLSGMWECPLTRWDSEGIDIKKAQAQARRQPSCPLEIRASPADNAKGAQYFADNKTKLKKELLKYGAIWFRGFDLMKSVDGHRTMHEALG
eukprot:121107_1